MRWSAGPLANYAETAGFQGDELVTAVAVAKATSDGDDAWHWTGGQPWVTDQRGVWGIDVALYPELGQFDLYDPWVNATAAWWLYSAAGGSWEWAPAWVSGAWQRFLGSARYGVEHPDARRQVRVLEPAGVDPANIAKLVDVARRTTLVDAYGQAMRVQSAIGSGG